MNKLKKINRLYFILMFVGAFAITFGVFLFENTIVNWKIPTIIFLLTGAIMTPITIEKLKNYCKIKNYLLVLLYNIVTFGGILVGILLAINYYIRSPEQYHYKLKILNVEYTSRNKKSCKIPTAIIKLNNTTKGISFPCGFELKPYSYIEIYTKKGILGYEIIVYKNPKVQY